MVEMIDAKTAQVRRLLNVPRYDVPAVAYAPNGCCLAIALGGNEVNVWTAASLSSSRGLPAPIARLVIASVTTALGWSPDSNLLAIGTVIGNVVVWPASGGASRVLMIGGKHGQLWSLQWSPLPGRLAVGWADGTVSILVGRNLVLAQTLHAPAAINTLAWSGDGALLAISATGKPVTIWEANTGVAVQSIAAYWDTNQLAWSPDGRTLASVDDGDGLTLLMMHPPASLLGGLACDLQGALCTSTRGHGGTVPSYMGR
jgi:WD40 repeat protein